MKDLNNKIAEQTKIPKDFLFECRKLKKSLNEDEVKDLNDILLSMCSEIQGVLSRYCKSEDVMPKIAEEIKTAEDLGDELCNYCPLPDECKGARSTGNCEGSRCSEAYEEYLETNK